MMVYVIRAASGTSLGCQPSLGGPWSAGEGCEEQGLPCCSARDATDGPGGTEGEEGLSGALRFLVASMERQRWSHAPKFTGNVQHLSPTLP